MKAVKPIFPVPATVLLGEEEPGIAEITFVMQGKPVRHARQIAGTSLRPTRVQRQTRLIAMTRQVVLPLETAIGVPPAGMEAAGAKAIPARAPCARLPRLETVTLKVHAHRLETSGASPAEARMAGKRGIVIKRVIAQNARPTITGIAMMRPLAKV